VARKKKEKESKPKGIEKEIASNVSDIVELERAQRKKRTIGEQLSEVVAGFCGSMTCVYVHIVWFGFWIIFNDIPSVAFDPFPYTFLTLVVSLEAIFLSTFILISQNHDTQLSERRNHLDLQINMLAEQENTKMLELLQKIAEKVGVDCDPQLDVLMEPIDPKKLVKQIVKASGEEEKNGLKKAAKADK
jgi:uncharacterized membrane protein